MPAKPAATAPAHTFETAMTRLESVVEEMGSDQLPLEDLITRYEEGIKLVKVCEERLQTVEKRVEMLTRTAAHEQELLGNRHIRLHALSPGVIDTEMQTQIRAADAVQFSEVQTFRDRHARHELLTPAEAARQVAAFLARPVPWPEVVAHLQNVPK